MKLNNLASTYIRKKKRVGRGIGSGKGKTCGSGVKGQKARSGVAIKGFEGGQNPIHMRLPKRGFTNPNKIQYKIVNLDQIDKLVIQSKKTKLTKLDLVNYGLLSNQFKRVKLLGNGEITQKVEIEVDSFSSKAESAVVKLGGKIIALAQKSYKDIENESSKSE